MPDAGLKARVQSEMIAAMKAGNKERTQVVRMLLSEIKRKESDDPAAKPEDAVSAYAKVLKKAMADMEKHNRPDHVQQIQAELAIVDEFLPRQMDDAALKTLADSALTPLGSLSAKDTGRAIGAVMKAVAAAGSSADPGKVRALVEARIAAGA
jgi:hypothetical protein